MLSFYTTSSAKPSKQECLEGTIRLPFSVVCRWEAAKGQKAQQWVVSAL